MVCKGWSDTLSWLEISDSAARNDQLRQVLMSAHGRLEGINTPFVQVKSAGQAQMGGNDRQRGWAKLWHMSSLEYRCRASVDVVAWPPRHL